MKRQRAIPDEALSEYVTRLSERAVARFLELLATEEIAVVHGPLTGLIMMSARDTFEADFHLGEVLVTEVEVSYAGFRGYGMVIGDDPERAIARASLEAVGVSSNRPLRERLQRFLHAEARKIEAAGKKENALITRTRVSFETMKRT